MKIYIDNEEVICAKDMKIKKQLSQANSVILNNIYPISWEEDKDYVSRFYMPKDYTKGVIIDENIVTQTEYDLSNNITDIERRYIVGSTRTITYKKNSVISTFIKVIPNREYKIRLKNNYNGNTILYEVDNLDFGTEANSVIMLSANDEGEFTITPTRKYLIATKMWNSTNYLDIESIKTTVSDNLLFSGIIKNSGNIELNPRYPHYSTLQLLDFASLLSEGDTLNFVLNRQTTKSALQTIVNTLDGFMLGTIDLEGIEEIGPYNCNEKTPHDVFQFISEITGSIWYTKTISEDITLINFCSTNNLPKTDDIDYTQEYFENNNIIDIAYSYNTQDYRNKQSITADNITSNVVQTENIMYMESNIELSYPVSSIVSIKSKSSNYSFATDKAKSNGITAQFYYQKGSNVIEVNTNLVTGLTLTVEYYSLIESRQVAYNQTEVNRIQEQTGRNGIISRYEKRSDTTNETALSQIAQTYLDYKGVPEVTVNIRTHNRELFEIGNVVFFNGPLESLKTNYLVVAKEINMIVTGNQQEIFYEYKLSSSFNDENAINYFDNQRRKLTGDIGEGEYIPRYIDIPSSTNIIFYDLEFEEMPVAINILDGELDIELFENVEPSKNALDGELDIEI